MTTKTKPDRTKPVAKRKPAVKPVAKRKPAAKKPAPKKSKIRRPGRRGLAEANQRVWPIQLRFTNSEMEALMKSLDAEGPKSTVTGFLTAMALDTIPKAQRRTQ